MGITGSVISRVEILDTLSRIKALSNQAKTVTTEKTEATHAQPFHDVMGIASEAVSKINHTQIQTEALKHAYMNGDPTVSISQVMVSSMESKLAFEGLLVVRNKLLDAYKEIMNMPV